VCGAGKIAARGLVLTDERQQQIPFRNDRKKGKCDGNDNGKSNSRSFDCAPVGRFAQDDIIR